jgi:hypothetical protein
METNKKNHMVSLALDGASVMMGEHQSVSALFKQEHQKLVVTHAVAHRLELGVNDACANVVYLIEVEELLKDLYAFFEVSAKRLADMGDVAEMVQETTVKFGKMHGIRWMESKQRAVIACLRNYKVSVTALEVSALTKAGVLLNSRSPGNSFLRLQYWEGRWKATVCGIEWKDGVEMLTVMYSNRQQATLLKSEVAKFLANSKEEKLAQSREWQMHLELTSYRMVITLHFLVDFDGELKVLSMVFQTRALTISDVIDGLERTTGHLRRMLVEDDVSLKEFYNEFDETTESYKGWVFSSMCSLIVVLRQCGWVCRFPLDKVAEGKAEFAKDRKLLIDTAIQYSENRFGQFAKDPVMQASRAFEHRRWSSLQAAELQL